MTGRTLPAIVGLGLLSAQPLLAQRLADYERFPILESRAPLASFQAQKPKTYWVEGGVIGGVLTGAIGVTLSGLCAPNTGSCPGNKLLSFVIGAVPGFIIGGMIGDTIKKEPT